MIYLLTVFVGAFLLFQVQPLIAKLILPYFGGGASVWTACMLFFQGALLFGYFYAHVLAKITAIKKQLVAHGSLLLISLIILPMNIDTSLAQSTEQPLLAIVIILLKSIGLPYILLAATGPILQKWYSDEHQGKQPYFLYSWSNVASLLALLSFPFIVEPNFTSSLQRESWSLLYVLYIIVFAVLIVKKLNKKQGEEVANTVENEEKLSRILPIYWLAFSALGVVFLVATTNAITQNVAPVPFLWILPLCIYLLTFIISFHSEKWYVRWYWLALFSLSALIAIFLHYIGSQFDIATQVLLFSCILFSACMVCHGELARSKPCTSQLTYFYLLLALGGFLGSMFVAFIATNIFTQFLEFPLAFISLFILLSIFYRWEGAGNNRLAVFMFAGGVFSCGLFFMLNKGYQQNDIFQARNFYGVLSVKDVEIEGEKQRRLIDGTTSHGTQYIDDNKKHIPLSYYRKTTGGALAIELLQQKGPINVGLIGLGAGALAAYGQEGDRFNFYELNPAVVNAAQNYFSYLSDSAADINIVEGDARISIEKQAKQLATKPFDLLVLDAFSGDSIPQHLLTIEALTLYQNVLKEDGVIAIHISNTHLNLQPLAKGLAEQGNYSLVYFNTKGRDVNQHDTQWVWLTRNEALIQKGQVKLYRTTPHEASDDAVVWMDDYSNLMSLLK